MERKSQAAQVADLMTYMARKRPNAELVIAAPGGQKFSVNQVSVVHDESGDDDKAKIRIDVTPIKCPCCGR